MDFESSLKNFVHDQVGHFQFYSVFGTNHMMKEDLFFNDEYSYLVVFWIFKTRTKFFMIENL